MATTLDELADFLAAAGLGLTAGTNLFQNDLPDQPDKAVALYEDPGAPPVRVMGTGVKSKTERPRVQVVVRDRLNVNARALAESIYQATDAVVNTTLGSTFWLKAEPVGEPALLDRDTTGPEPRYLFVFDLDLEKEVST